MAEEKFQSRLTNCLIITRDGETLFYFDEEDRILASLDGYAIIPIEEYERLSQGKEVKP